MEKQIEYTNRERKIIFITLMFGLTTKIEDNYKTLKEVFKELKPGQELPHKLRLDNFIREWEMVMNELRKELIEEK